MDLSDLIERNAAFTPDKPATIFEDETLSYAAFGLRIAQAARALKAEFGFQRARRLRDAQPESRVTERLTFKDGRRLVRRERRVPFDEVGKVHFEQVPGITNRYRCQSFETTTLVAPSG